jgi:Fic family protein
MKILSDKYFDQYKHTLHVDLSNALKEIKEIELTSQSFTFYTSVAVISSSKIEGEKMEVDSYLKHKIQNIEYLPELTEKPNDLFNAYLFAKENKLNKENFLQSHVLLSKHLLPEKWSGAYRNNEMLVMEHNTGKIQFEAAPFSIVESEMEKLWDDISALLEKKLSNETLFYYASFIHLVFVNIHPFNDGNGRAARLLEKWFLAEMLGETAWYIQSEKYYYQHVNDYYKNLNRLGVFYEKLDYSKADNFFQMLPNAIVSR